MSVLLFIILSYTSRPDPEGVFAGGEALKGGPNVGCGIQEQSTGYISGIMLSLHQTTEFVIKIKVKIKLWSCFVRGGICLL